MIYFMQPVGGGPVKIGCSANVEKRHAQLESLYGCPLVVLGTMKGDRKTENSIHKQFSHLRFGQTEQFQPAAELMEFIGRPLLVGANPEAVEVMPIIGSTPCAVVVRGTAEWREWLTGLARHRGLSQADTIAQALMSYAAQWGYRPMPERKERP